MNKLKVCRSAPAVVSSRTTTTMRYILSICAFAVLAFGQTAPSVTAITNAALPDMDMHVPTRLQPRSLRGAIKGSHFGRVNQVPLGASA
jgi:hypothetical protein